MGLGTFGVRGDLGIDSSPLPKTVVTRFNEASDVEAWTATWGSSPVLEFDPMDAGGGTATSGSLKVSADYFTPEDNGWEQMVITTTFPEPIVGADHVSVSVDIRVDPASIPTAAGQYGYFEFKRTDGTALGGLNLTSTNWTTITFDIPPTEGSVTGLIVQNGNGGFLGPVTYYLDNLVFTQRGGGPNPPTLSIARNANPGLRAIASAPGQAYQRQNIVYAGSEDLGNLLWWVNQSQPVTYSVTWAEFPDPQTQAGFQGHVILSTDTGGSNTPDWNDANVILVEFQYANHVGADGVAGTADDAVRARARFLHKVNEAAGNAMLYRTQENAAAGPVGVLGELWAPTMIGTWNVAFLNNTDITLTAPDGSTVSLKMPDSDVASYEPTTAGVSAQFGIQPNADSRIGLAAVISRVKIQKGSTVVVDDAFTTPELNATSWLVRAADAGGLVPVPQDVKYLVGWNLPDDGFVLKGASTVSGPWSDIAGVTQVGARRLVRVGTAALPGAGAGYFQLVKAP